MAGEDTAKQSDNPPAASLENTPPHLSLADDHFKKLIEDSGDVLWELCPSGKFSYVNKNVEALFGYNADEFINRHFSEIMSKEEAAQFDNALVKAARSVPGEVQRLTRQVSCKDGSRVFLDTTIRVLQKPDQKSQCFLGIDRLAQAKQPKEQLAQSEEHFSSLIHELPDGIAELDTAGDLLFISGVDSGVNSHSLVGKPFVDSLSDEEKPIFLETLEKVTTKKKSSYYTVSVRQDGLKPRHWVNRLVPVLSKKEGEDEIEKIMILRLDITEYRRTLDTLAEAEKQLRQSQKMEAIGQLAGGVAHDFNNLLQAITAEINLLIMDGGLSSDCEARLNSVLTTVDQAAQITRGMLNFSRMANLDIHPVSTQRVLRQVERLLRHGIERRIDICTRFGEGNDTINADPTQLEQVLINLGFNARDAIADVGTITLGARRVVLKDRRDKDGEKLEDGVYIEITVADTGCGISPENLGKLFEPFFTTKDVGYGTGLGLSSAYGIIKGHHGLIEVESELNKGTVFRVFLKACEQRETKASPSNPRDVIRGFGWILVVEDEPSLRDALVRILTMLGYETTTANDGADALWKYPIVKDTIDLVILDMNMPRLNGHDCFLEMKRLDPSVRCLLITGYHDSEEIQDCLNKGVLGVIHKPFQMKPLSEAIARAIGIAEA